MSALPARALVAWLAVMGCARPWHVETRMEPDLDLHALPADDPAHVARRDALQIADGIRGLWPVIGAYPTQIRSSSQRANVYAEWSSLLLDARATAWRPEAEEGRLWTLGELYRLGHNLDVAQSAELADRDLTACVSKFPRSVPCNWSLVWFYLSVQPTPERLASAERSLGTLREVRGPSPDERVEATFVQLRLHQNDEAGAERAMEQYLKDFPDGESAEIFQKLRSSP